MIRVRSFSEFRATVYQQEPKFVIKFFLFDIKSAPLLRQVAPWPPPADKIQKKAPESQELENIFYTVYLGLVPLPAGFVGDVGVDG